jgi:mannose-6-phosphate isomerase-like protein (cupin superfamily)
MKVTSQTSIASSRRPLRLRQVIAVQTGVVIVADVVGAQGVVAADAIVVATVVAVDEVAMSVVVEAGAKKLSRLFLKGRNAKRGLFLLCKYFVRSQIAIPISLEEIKLKRFDKPDEVRLFEKGRFELVNVGGMVIGRASYEPGWKWSVHVGRPGTEKLRCVVSGRATAAMDDGRIVEMKSGDLFYIAPGHDSWVVGDEPYVSFALHGRQRICKGKVSEFKLRRSLCA